MKNKLTAYLKLPIRLQLVKYNIIVLMYISQTDVRLYVIIMFVICNNYVL